MVEAKKVADNTYSQEKAMAPKKCPNCGLMNKCTATVCRKCKTELPKPKKVYRCPKCGNGVYEDEPYCSECKMSMEDMLAAGAFEY